MVLAQSLVATIEFDSVIYQALINCFDHRCLLWLENIGVDLDMFYAF